MTLLREPFLCIAWVLVTNFCHNSNSNSNSTSNSSNNNNNNNDNNSRSSSSSGSSNSRFLVLPDHRVESILVTRPIRWPWSACARSRNIRNACICPNLWAPHKQTSSLSLLALNRNLCRDHRVWLIRRHFRSHSRHRLKVSSARRPQISPRRKCNSRLSRRDCLRNKGCNTLQSVMPPRPRAVCMRLRIRCRCMWHLRRSRRQCHNMPSMLCRDRCYQRNNWRRGRDRWPRRSSCHSRRRSNNHHRRRRRSRLSLRLRGNSNSLKTTRCMCRDLRNSKFQLSRMRSRKSRTLF